jgi:hypothetical protein
MQRIFGIIGWIGTALVFGAVAVRLLGSMGYLPSTEQVDRYAVYAAWAGLACVVLYTIGQWRDIVSYFRGRNARYGAIASVSVIVVLAILGIVNYLSQERFNKRWDSRPTGSTACRSRASSCCAISTRRWRFASSTRPRTWTATGRAWVSTSTSRTA